MENRDQLEKRVLYTFNKKGGTVVRRAEGLGRGLLGMYALQNTSKGRISILVFDSDNAIERIYIGSPEGCPDVIYPEKLECSFGYLDEYIKDEKHINIQQLTDAIELSLVENKLKKD